MEKVSKSKNKPYFRESGLPEDHRFINVARGGTAENFKAAPKGYILKNLGGKLIATGHAG